MLRGLGGSPGIDDPFFRIFFSPLEPPGRSCRDLRQMRDERPRGWIVYTISPLIFALGRVEAPRQSARARCPGS